MDDLPSREQLVDALDKARGSVSVVANIYGVTRQAIYRLIAKYGIVIERPPVRIK